MLPVWRRETARYVVIPHQILRVSGELLVRRIEKIVIGIVHEGRSDCDLKLRAVIAHAQHRLRDCIEDAEIPCRRSGLRYSLRYPVESNVMCPQRTECRGRTRIHRKELIVPLRRLE